VRLLLRLARAIDRFTEAQGSLATYLVLVVVIIGFYNVATRYLGRYIGVQLASNTYIELQKHLFSAIFFLGFAYVLKHHLNVRVDFFYNNWRTTTKAWVDLIGTVISVIPFCLIGFYATLNPMLRSWRTGEVSGDAGGLVLAPVRTLLFVSFIFLLLQSLAQIIKYAAVIRGLEENTAYADEAAIS